MRRATGPRLGLAYEEALSGAQYVEGAAHLHGPISIRLSAEAPSLCDLVRRRTIAVRGVLEAPGIAARAPVEGEIRLSGSRDRLVAYRLSFVDDEGRPLLFVAHKRLVPRHLYASLTVLTGTIEEASGVVRARCTLRFDVRTDLSSALRTLRLFRPDLDRD